MKTIYIYYVMTAFALISMVFFAQPIVSNAKNRIEFKKATFAGGCFWCMEKPFESLDGVMSVTTGYLGGETENPDYQNYAGGGHIEAVEIIYDPEKVSYPALLSVFWRQIDPTDPGGQFADRGRAYSTAVFYHDDAQRLHAERSRQEMDDQGVFKKPIVTPVLPVPVFYRAEGYHQNYYKRNPIRYKYYRKGSGRDRFLDSTWGKNREIAGKKAEDLRQRLTPLQYRVTQKEGTEPAYDNKYWDNRRDGIYVDIVSGEPLFSSLDKYDSQTGWPSFFKPLVSDNIVERVDRKLFTSRVEVRSRHADSHLGHVFEDGPDPSGLRYCLNSAALRFVPVEEMREEGYGDFLDVFRK